MTNADSSIFSEETSLFDFLPTEEADRFRSVKSNEWKWKLSDYPQSNGIKVFSCFACGGGSTMGYKLAGCDVVGCCEIDKAMNDIYVANHHPSHNFLMDIRDFNRLPKIPDELYGIDILDGSPPCTSFSISGDRDKSWGKKKKFREGQTEQTLDDLPFVFIDTVKMLRPKVVVMENVTGILLGTAIKYANEIYTQFDKLGYRVKHYVLHAERMGVPQKRHRVFWVAVRSDISFDFDSLDMAFDFSPITFGEIRDGNGKQPTSRFASLLLEARYDEKDLVRAWNRINNPSGAKEKRMLFNCILVHKDDVCPTIPAGHSCMYDFECKRHLSRMDIIHASTFPEDFNFCGANVDYVCGMSVPPVMMKRVAERIIQTNVFHR